jgi:predicted Ser/Thr protein kinase
LGRVALPNLPDTVIRVEGTTLRADIGRPIAWRVSFHGDSLFRVERVQGDRVAEWVDRSDPSHIQYRNESARRSVQLTITRTEDVGEFDASIWRFDR